MLNVKEVEKDEFANFQPRDLLRVSDTVLNNPMLMAIVESGNSPKDCYGYIKKLGFNDDTAYQVKAAVRARLEIERNLERSQLLNPNSQDAAAQIWSFLRSTQQRPSSIFLFPDMGTERLTPCEAIVFGKQTVDRQFWPYLLREFMYRPRSAGDEHPTPLTTFDYDGSHFLRLNQFRRVGDEWEQYPYGPKSVKGMDGSWSYVLYDGMVPVLYWSMEHASYGCLVSSCSNILPSPDPLCSFPRCYKLIKIEKHLPSGGCESIRIKLRQDLGPQAGTPINWNLGELSYERCKPIGGLLEARLVLKYSIDRDLLVRWGYKRGDDFVLTGFARKPDSDEPLSRDLFKRVSFMYSDNAYRCVHQELVALGHRILCSELPTLERIAGRTFLESPPAELAELFTTS